MKIVAVMPVRNEDWILGLSARAALMWADELALLDHASTDRTLEIMHQVSEEFPGRVSIHTWTDPLWAEMAQRQALLEDARAAGATHIAIVDADEVLTGTLLPTIREQIERTHPRQILQLPWLQLRGSLNKYHTGGVWAEQWVSFAFQDSPDLHWAARDGYDFHHRHPMGRQLIPFRPEPFKRGGLMHLQMVDERRLRAKQALYLCTEVLRWPGRTPIPELQAQYNQAVYAQKTRRPPGEPLALGAVPAAWWEPYRELAEKHLKLFVNEQPWQEVEVQRLWKEHGPEKFAGLDLYGVEVER